MENSTRLVDAGKSSGRMAERKRAQTETRDSTSYFRPAASPNTKVGLGRQRVGRNSEADCTALAWGGLRRPAGSRHCLGLAQAVEERGSAHVGPRCRGVLGGSPERLEIGLADCRIA